MPLRADETDSPAVDAARVLLQFVNDLHGAHLGSTGNGGTGKQAGENIDHGGLGASSDSGGHLQQGGIALDVEQAGDGHAAGLRDATQIIAEHVHDHHVFSTVLFRLSQPVTMSFIFRQRPTTGGGALHRLCDQLFAVQREK